MFARYPRTRAQRRGVVLILILGMLGLLALIGVTFATFSNQAQISARNFSQAQNFPDASEVMDYALSQLIDDSANPNSVIRGHSFRRDMYGSDAATNGALANALDGTQMYVRSASYTTTGVYAGMLRLVTSLPSSNQPSLYAPYYGMDFTRWLLRFPAASDPGTTPTSRAAYVARTHEILVDDHKTDPNYRIFYIAIPNIDIENILSPMTPVPKSPPSDPSIKGYTSLTNDLPTVSGAWTSTLTTLPNGSGKSLPAITSTLSAGAPYFTLDGRFLRAFNGPGVDGLKALKILGTAATGLDNALVANAPRVVTVPPGHPLSEYGNFRYNGNIFRNVVDGFADPKSSPSLNPGYGDPNDSRYIPAMDEDYDAVDLENWFLAMQSADGQVVIPSFHRPGIISNDGSVTYNDWNRAFDPATFSSLPPEQQLLVTRAMSRVLRPRRAEGHSSISFPDLVPDGSGKIHYDVDNDGDGVTDSVWLDLGYPAKRDTQNHLFKPLFAFMVVGLNGRLPLNTAGNLQHRDNLLNPTVDHADHLGYSPSEIDLRYALQNAWDPNYTPPNPAPYQQVDNAGITAVGDSPHFVWRTQLRNLLKGTRQPDPTFNPNLAMSPTNLPAANGDINVVMVNSQYVLLPNGVADQGDYLNPAPTSTAPGQVQRHTLPVAGRWGEEDAVPGILYLPMGGPYQYNNQIGPGNSMINGTANDARDDNGNAFDFNGENNDTYDGAGSIVLPVERLRRFVNPVDVAGDGRVITFGSYDPTFVDPITGAIVGRVRVNGGDLFGRVNFFRYFRPAGFPLATFAAGKTTIPNEPAPISTGLASVWFDPATPPRYDVRTNNIYRGFTSYLTPDPGFHGPVGAPIPNPAVTALALNAMPSDKYPSTSTGVRPINEATDGSPPAAVVAPTYTAYLNSNIITNVFSSAGLNEADEMDLYHPTRLDAPFGPSDLEWLYRAQDVDGSSLQSRLAFLAPISFLNPRDGNRRRRLFALDSWDTTNFVWANDNPQGTFASNSRFTPVANASFFNLNYGNYLKGSPAVLYPGSGVNNLLTPDPASDFGVVSNSIPSQETLTTGVQVSAPTPSIAHRDRRINLNFPLPVSNSPIEPVRQKWVRETYQLLKAILPPRAVDTPEELAQLSQYVVNVVDFRDPDCTMTKFVNTDVIVNEPTSVTQQAILAYSTTTTPPHPPNIEYDWTYDPMTSPTPPATTANPALHYLVQYGMENQPVAINEVLAYQFQTMNVDTSNTSGDPNNDVPRMFVEMVNLLTKDSIVNNPDSSDLDLAGWDFVVLPDDGYGRPDPFTGQVPQVQPGLWTPAPTLQPFLSISLAGGSAKQTATMPTPVVALPGSGAFPPLAALTASTAPFGTTSADIPPATTPPQVYYYVFGPPPTPAQSNGVAAELTPPVVSTTRLMAPSPTEPNGYVDLTGMLHQRKTTTPTGPPAAAPLTDPGYYYWLYVRRPANPFDPTGPKVVVDSFRFPYTKANGVGFKNSTGTYQVVTAGTTTNYTPASDYQFSLERLQPLRGGHAVPPLTVATAGTTNTFIPSYGYTEQTEATQASVGTYTQGQYQAVALKSTNTIYHTLGVLNSPSDQTWDYFPFNDRDFTSVIELTTVPGTPPGLFTKQFAELSPPILANYLGATAYAYVTPVFGTVASPGPLTATLTPPPSIWAGTAWASGGTGVPNQFGANGTAHTFPYLNDEFFYTGSGEPVTWVAGETATPNFFRASTPLLAGAPGNYVGGPAACGWFKMFEFFEVPSPAYKSIGPVAQGNNYDWARQDLRPGLINLNLIIDEEVFLGVMGSALYAPQPGIPTGVLNQGQIGMPGNPGMSPPYPASPSYASATTPFFVNQTDDTGKVYGFRMPNVGAYDPDGFTDRINNMKYPDTANTGITANALMKACFADFLSLRHGASGNVFGFQNERPFHALSYPDINYTILRPAALPPTSPPAVGQPPPSYLTTPAGPSPAYPWITATALTDSGSTTAAPNPIIWDVGLKNPYLFTTSPNRLVAQPPPVPPRRLFQIPDAYGSPNGPSNHAPALAGNATNASVPGDPNVNTQTQLAAGLSIINSGNSVTSAYPDLTTVPAPTSGGKYSNGDIKRGIYLGGNNFGGGAPPYDQTDHPYFRTEWLQRVANLTTVRTHQYAVWITVGFFEVTRQGDPMLAGSRIDLAFDTLGLELGVLEGKNVRYRGFFLVDRTKAAGFNPNLPSDFRDCVTYRQLIE